MTEAELIAVSIWSGAGLIAFCCDTPRERLIDSIISMCVAIGWVGLGIHLFGRISES